MRTVFGRDPNALASLRIASGPRRDHIHAETSKIPDLDPVATRERILHRRQDQVDCRFDILLGKSWKVLDQAGGQIRFKHAPILANRALSLIATIATSDRHIGASLNRL